MKGFVFRNGPSNSCGNSIYITLIEPEIKYKLPGAIIFVIAFPVLQEKN